jgi:hypothetical protein
MNVRVCRSETWTMILGLFVLLLAPGSGVPAQTTDDRILNTIQATSRSFIDWENKRLHILLSAPVDSGDIRNRSTLVSRKETELKNMFAPLFPLFIQPLRIDSSRHYIDLMKLDPNLALRVKDLQAEALLLRSQPTEDLRTITLEYLLPLVPHLTAPLVDFQQPIELDRILSWHPKAEYSGLVVHATGPLPWFGSDRNASLSPALFPRILDEDSRVILDVGRMLPVAARRWGTAAYVSAANSRDLSDRVGANPLITTARGVFGTTPSDIIISKADADQLLYDESSRRALREGRILIVVDAEALMENIRH